MAADTIWPSALPQAVHLQGYAYQPGNHLVSSDMDVGPPKVRRRTTFAPAQEQWLFTLTYAQKVIFEDFFAEDLAQGALTFEFGEVGAPMYVPGYLLTEDGFAIETEDLIPITLDYRWTVTRTYRFLPNGQPFSFSRVGTAWRLACSVLRLS